LQPPFIRAFGSAPRPSVHNQIKDAVTAVTAAAAAAAAATAWRSAGRLRAQGVDIDNRAEQEGSQAAAPESSLNIKLGDVKKALHRLDAVLEGRKIDAERSRTGCP